jgi:ABC-type nitrate/sulfonate/bicarbonate transport system permease component
MSSVASSSRVGFGGGPQARPRSAVVGAITASPWTYRLIVLVIVAVAWEVYGTNARSLIIPTFSETVIRTGQLLFDGGVWRAFIDSNQALVIGFFASVVLGLPLGLAAARFERLEKFLDPYINIMLVTPTAALIPIFLMVPALGFSLQSRVLLVIVFAIPMLIVNARAGVRQVDPSLIEMSTSFLARERTIWRKVLLPGALPAIMTGVRLAVGRAITGMVIVELLMFAVGIGHLIINARGRFDGPTLYGVVILIVLESLVLISAARWLERRVAPWAAESVLAD